MTVTNRKIDPIEPSSTPGGFIRAARLLPDGVDWSGGVSFLQNCGGTSTWSCDFAGATKDIPQTQDPVEFDPFIVYAGERCSGKPFTAELEQLARNKLVRSRSGSMAQELHSSAYGNPGLVDSATDITPVGGAPCINNAIAGLLSAACDCSGGDVVIHAPLVVLASLMQYDLVKYEDGRYRLGAYTVIVDCYPNVEPDGGTPPAEDEVWLYSTGPVEYAMGNVEVIQNFDNETNEDVVLAEQLSILRFDPCCVHAIRASIC